MCNTSLAAAWPSAGGADCPDPCGDGETCATTTYRLGEDASPAGRAFQASMLAAGKALQGFGDVTTESGTQLHMSLNYLCCYSADDLAVARAALDAMTWEPINVTFDAPVWRIDGSRPPISATHYSAIVLLDAASNARMQAWVAEVEARIAAAGVAVHVPRHLQQPFHSTLAVADGAAFPVEAALAAANAAVPPGSWTGGRPITVTRPRLW